MNSSQQLQQLRRFFFAVFPFNLLVFSRVTFTAFINSNTRQIDISVIGMVVWNAPINRVPIAVYFILFSSIYVPNCCRPYRTRKFCCSVFEIESTVKNSAYPHYNRYDMLCAAMACLPVARFCARRLCLYSTVHIPLNFILFFVICECCPFRFHHY